MTALSKHHASAHKPNAKSREQKVTPLPLTDNDLAQLETLLDQLAATLDADDVDVQHPMSLDGVDGLFAALALSPSTTAIADWMSLVFGDAAFDNKDMTQTLRNLLIRHNNSVIHLLRKTDMEAFTPCVSLYEDDESGEEYYDVSAWCTGFALGYERQEDKWHERMDEPALAEVNALIALKEMNEQGEIEITDDMTESEAEFREHQMALVELMRSEISDMLQEPVDNLTLLIFALKGLQTVMLSTAKTDKRI
jgi:yecA family protein